MKLPIQSLAAVQQALLRRQVLPYLLRQATFRIISVQTIARAAGVQTRRIVQFVVLLMYTTRPSMRKHLRLPLRPQLRLRRLCRLQPPSRRKMLPVFGTILVLKVVPVDLVMQAPALHAVVRWRTTLRITINTVHI